MKPDLDPYLARDIFVGTMDHMVTRWLLRDMSYSLFDNLEKTFDLMVAAFRNDQSRTSESSAETGREIQSGSESRPENDASGQSEPEAQGQRDFTFQNANA